MLQLIRFSTKVEFSSAERATARLLGHVLGMLASNFSQSVDAHKDSDSRLDDSASKPKGSPAESFSKWGGKVPASQAIELAAARGPLTLRHLVQSRRAAKVHNKSLVESGQGGRMQTFLNFLAQLNSVEGIGEASVNNSSFGAVDPRRYDEEKKLSKDPSDPSQDTSVGRLIRIALQQAKELLLCSGVEIFALSPLPFCGGVEDPSPGNIVRENLKKKIVRLGSTLSNEIQSIDLDSDSPIARTILYSRPVVSAAKDMSSTIKGSSISSFNLSQSKSF